MSLPVGTRLGVYEVRGPLGAGAMGEVHLARDVRLDRDVAIKVLPATFASDRDRLLRFEREARMLASLNHPNIAQIYGVIDPPADGESGLANAALVMEFVEGDDLAVRLARGAIAPEDALPIARQIADALEAAHERGIIHRDLKPANVKVRPDGTVKVLDFGLAKAIDQAAAPLAPAAIGDMATVTTIPTVEGGTQVGGVLGTAAYMAPEQARGGMVDRRVDIWAFGCVLYEMLAGRRPFNGGTLSEVLSALQSREPDWSALPPLSPEVMRLLRRCLDKDPRRRLRDIGEARLTLEGADGRPPATAPGVRIGASQPLVAVLVIGGVMLGVAAAVLVLRPWFAGDPPQPAIARFDVSPPDSTTLAVVFRTAIALSADGSTMAFTATSEGISRIYVRRRSDVVPRVVPGSEGGISPELSPDGRWVAFYANGNVLKAPVDGRASTIAPGRDVRGIAWADDNTLVLTAEAAAPLVRMSEAGDDMRPITSLAAGERTHRWPDVLPGSAAVLFTVGSVTSPDHYDDSTIEAVLLATGERRVVLKDAAMARYCGGNQLIYSRGPALFAVAFDPGRLRTSGAAAQIVPAVARDASTGAAQFDCAGDGTLVYVPGAVEGDLRRLVWSTRDGTLQPTSLGPGPYSEVRVSPDGTRAAILDGNYGTADVWIHEFSTGAFTRLTFNTENGTPAWSADGAFVYFATGNRTGTGTVIMKQRADGTGEAQSVRAMTGRIAVAWVHPDQQIAIVDAFDPISSRGDILRVSLASAAEPERLVATPANEYGASVSPDGQWLAYQADDTGRPEIYVRDLASGRIRRQVTITGGEEPYWSGDGHELFYRIGSRLMSVAVETAPSFRVHSPRSVVDGLYNTGNLVGRSYHVSPSTGRFLLVQPADGGQSARVVRVVLNWPALLRQQ